MSNYNKFLKYRYKNQNLFLKKQIGGEFNLEEWTKIPNSGQRNCGIFISELYPDRIVKCGGSDMYSKIQYVFDINGIMKLYPTIFDNKLINEQYYVTMQKLDGDITDIYFNVLPNHVLNNMIESHMINDIQKNDILKLFKGKMNYTMDNPNRIWINISDIISDIDKYQKEFDIIKTITPTITIDIYDTFIAKLIETWDIYHPIITKEIIKLILLLLNLGYHDNDNKFDNYGYILSDIKLDDIRGGDVPKIFDKYFYVYGLDFDGLDKIKVDDYKNIFRYLISDVNGGLNFGVNGQYNLTYLNGNSLLNYYEFDLTPLNINPEIISILQKQYTFDITKFKHNFTNIREIETFAFGVELTSRPEFISIESKMVVEPELDTEPTATHVYDTYSDSDDSEDSEDESDDEYTQTVRFVKTKK
jgi:hypothetical protein